MSASNSILTISRDEFLQDIRSQVLRRGGYQVTAALTDHDAIRAVEGPNTFRLVLLCHSVPEASRVFIVNGIKALRPNLPVLMLYNGYDPTTAKVDGSLHSLESPAALLDMIRFLMEKGAPQ